LVEALKKPGAITRNAIKAMTLAITQRSVSAPGKRENIRLMNNYLPSNFFSLRQ
jgi:hypothetical protein